MHEFRMTVLKEAEYEDDHFFLYKNNFPFFSA